MIRFISKTASSNIIHPPNVVLYIEICFYTFHSIEILFIQLYVYVVTICIQTLTPEHREKLMHDRRTNSPYSKNLNTQLSFHFCWTYSERTFTKLHVSFFFSFFPFFILFYNNVSNPIWETSKCTNGLKYVVYLQRLKKCVMHNVWRRPHFSHS